VKGYRELCCKTCEGYTENAHAKIGEDRRLTRQGDTSWHDDDEDDYEHDTMLDYDNLDLDHLDQHPDKQQEP
jgi:hypothetical protein